MQVAAGALVGVSGKNLVIRAFPIYQMDISLQ